MAFFIGTDEAGYGPNLGPLTVTGTLWRVRKPKTDIYQELEDVVSDSVIVGRLAIADSKLLYQSSRSIKTLETSVLAIVYAMTGQIPSTWQELIQYTSGDGTSEFETESWLVGQTLTLPLAAETATIRELGSRFKVACSKSRVELLQIKCCPVFPSRFNKEVTRYGNKATFLSSVTLALTKELTDVAFALDADSELKIVCDKHGGRSKYVSLIADWLTEEFVWVLEEGRSISSYRWTEKSRDISAQFVARGESFLPTALASMVSKYVREVFMELWNRFWILRVPDLKPTKGYPLDAKRFKQDIAVVQKSLGISDDSIWRKK